MAPQQFGGTRPLRDYQERGFHWAANVPHPAIFWEPRLGKSILPLRRMAIDRVSGPVLIVGPYSSLHNWRRELYLEGVPASEMALLTGTKMGRLKALRSPAMFKLINKEGFRSCSEIASVRWEEMIVDESTFLKGPRKMKWSTKFGKRSNTPMFFTDNFRNVKRRWILTGTPSPESELDLFHQLLFLNPEILPFNSWWHFRHALFTQVDQYNYALLPENKERLARYLQPHCSYLSRTEVNLGIPVVHSRRMVRLSTKARKVYETAQRELILEYNGSVWGVADYGIEVYAWLRRICGGQLQDNNTFDFTHKVNELRELLKGELAQDPVVVWCSFVSELYSLANVLRQSNISNQVVSGSVSPAIRDTIFESFRHGDFQVLLCQPMVAQHSVDFSHCDTMIYYSTPMGLEVRLQTQDRFINVTKGGTKYIIDLVTEDTIEEDITLSLYKKESRQAMIRRIVKRLQKGTEI